MCVCVCVCVMYSVYVVCVCGVHMCVCVCVCVCGVRCVVCGGVYVGGMWVGVSVHAYMHVCVCERSPASTAVSLSLSPCTEPVHQGAFAETQGFLLSVSLSHHHELHQDVPKGEGGTQGVSEGYVM